MLEILNQILQFIKEKQGCPINLGHRERERGPHL